MVGDKGVISNRERLSYETVPKGNMGYDEYTVHDTVAVEPTLLLSFSTRKTYLDGLSCHSFKFL